MSKKDYELIAKTLRLSNKADNIYYKSMVNDFAVALKTTNIRFDMNKFLTACGIDG